MSSVLQGSFLRHGRAGLGTFGLLGPAGHDHLDAWHMCEERLRRLGVVMASMSHRTCKNLCLSALLWKAHA